MHKKRKMQKEKRAEELIMEEFCGNEMLFACSALYCCYDSWYKMYQFSYKYLKKRILEGSEGGRIAKHQKVLMETGNVTS